MNEMAESSRFVNASDFASRAFFAGIVVPAQHVKLIAIVLYESSWKVKRVRHPKMFGRCRDSHEIYTCHAACRLY